MRVDIFCESGSLYGLGHLYRCIKLIAYLCEFSLDSITLHNRGDFVASNSLLPSKFAESIEIKNYEWLDCEVGLLDIVFVDSYCCDKAFLQNLANRSKRLVCFDDELKNVYPQNCFIINAGICESSLNYTQKCFLGLTYAFVPQENLDSASASLNLKSAPQERFKSMPQNFFKSALLLNLDSRHILLSFGGVDRENLTQNALNELANMQGVFFHIVLGGGYENSLTLPQNLNINVYRNLPQAQFLALAKCCNVAISAGGGTLLELLSLGKAVIALQTASNQANQLNALKSKNAIKYASNVAEIKSLLQELLNDENKELLESIAKLKIGSKVKEMLEVILDSSHVSHSLNMTERITKLDFRLLDEKQKELVLKMRNDESVAKFMYSPHITKQAHKSFFDKLDNDNSQKYYLFFEGQEAIGVGSLTRISLSHHHAYIGIYKNPFSDIAFKGQKILNLLHLSAKSLGLHSLHLEVQSENLKAIKFYENFGYKQAGELKDYIYQNKRYMSVIIMSYMLED